LKRMKMIMRKKKMTVMMVESVEEGGRVSPKERARVVAKLFLS